MADTSIIEYWMHEPDAAEARAYLLSQNRIAGRLTDPEEVDADWVKSLKGGPSVDLLGCFSVGPHIDPWHPEWTALWVLQCAEGHALHIADKTAATHAKIRKPSHRVAQVVPLQVNQVVLFNSRRIHWLPKGSERKMLIAGNFEFDDRPTREQVDASIADAIASVTLPKAA